MACAENSDEKCYLHVITGQDFLCRKKEELFGFLSEDNFNNYMSCSDGSNNQFRYKTYCRNDWFDYKSKVGNFFTKFGHVIQKILRINRKPPLDYKIYKGMVYVSVTDEFARYVLDYLQTKEGECFFQWIRWCFIPEEFFFQTIAMNSKFAGTVEGNNLRYALWKEKHGSQPGILDEEDFNDIKASNAFFARKISTGISEELISKFM